MRLGSISLCTRKELDFGEFAKHVKYAAYRFKQFPSTSNASAQYFECTAAGVIGKEVDKTRDVPSGTYAVAIRYAL